MPSAVLLKVRIPTVGDSVVPAASTIVTFLTSHFPSVHDLIVSAFVAVKKPYMSTNERSLAVISSSFLASRAFHASHPAFSTASIASVFGSAAGLVSAVLEFATLAFFL